VSRRQEDIEVSTGATHCGRAHVYHLDIGAPRRPIPNPINTFTYTPSSPLLFRYSALTFNGHKIHYDRDWVRDVEGHPDLVVHGPLTSTLLTELAATIASDKGRTLERFDYRATSPMYVDREVRLIAGEDQEGKVQLVAEQEGVVGMKATATLR
jgi:3-methylfumaryl-CoA hydratase